MLQGKRGALQCLQEAPQHMHESTHMQHMADCSLEVTQQCVLSTATPLAAVCMHLTCVLALIFAGGRSNALDARANRWDAEEFERLKEERERLKAEIDVRGAACFCIWDVYNTCANTWICLCVLVRLLMHVVHVCAEHTCEAVMGMQCCLCSVRVARFVSLGAQYQRLRRSGSRSRRKST